MRYAIIDNGIVTNLIWLAERTTAEFPGAANVDDRPVCIGDTLVDGRFFHNGQEVLSTEEQLADMQAALAVLGVTDETEETV